MGENTLRFDVTQQLKRRAYLLRVLTGKIKCEKCLSANRNVGRVKLTFARDMGDIPEHVGQTRRKGEKHYHIVRAVFLLCFAIRQHALSVKAVTANEAVAREKITDLNAVFFAYVKYFVRAVSHSVHNDAFVCLGKILPKVLRGRIVC